MPPPPDARPPRAPSAEAVVLLLVASPGAAFAFHRPVAHSVRRLRGWDGPWCRAEAWRGACTYEFATDMGVTAPDGRRYWEPGLSPISVAFTAERVAAIISRGDRIVPEMVREACARAEVRPADIDR